MELTEEQKNLVQQFQFYQQQLQGILFQKESIKLQKVEIDKALEELSSSKQAKVYKIVGNIMVNKPAEDVKKELNDDKETLDVRIKSLEKAEEKVMNKLNELQEKLKGIIG
jgi:prefoldin beta subunit